MKIVISIQCSYLEQVSKRHCSENDKQYVLNASRIQKIEKQTTLNKLLRNSDFKELKKKYW